MSEVNIQWLGGKRFAGTDSTSHGIVISSADEDGGTGVKASDLLLLGLGACTAIDTVEIIQKKRQTFDKLEIRVEGKQDEDPPWTFRTIHIHFAFYSANLQPRAVEQAIELSQTKYCSVAATLRPTANIITSFEILPASGAKEA